ncbi:hypothetical protein KJA17_02355, partial [Patescibacteria group bacterium]|nr:hypothetical protein [Patescibacteria group bacterium]
GRKSLEDHLEFLQDAMADEFLDRTTKDELKEQYLKTIEAKRTQDRTIIDAQIEFNQKDRTADSINKAIASVKSQLTKPDIQKDEALRISYELQLATLEKEKLEIGIEDKMNWMAINLMSKDRKNPSLWKLETFSGFRDKGGNLPVNIGGVRYSSEQEYWQITLDNYVQNDFGNEYIAENKGEGALLWNKMGILPDSYLNNLITNNNIIRTHPELADFQIVMASAIQDSITNALSLKAKDLTAKYYLDKPTIATESDYQKAKSELTNLQNMFGEDYSLSPEIQKLETQLIEKRVATTEDILKVVGDVMADPEAYGESLDITWQEALSKYGETAAMEVPAKIYKEKAPLEVAKEITEAGEKIVKPEKVEKKPTPTIDPKAYAAEKGYSKYFQKGGVWYGNVAGTWKTFTSREEARQANIRARAAPPTPPTPTPTPAFDPKVYAKERGYTKYFQKGGVWYGAEAGVWKPTKSKEEARKIAGLK